MIYYMSVVNHFVCTRRTEGLVTTQHHKLHISSQAYAPGVRTCCGCGTSFKKQSTREYAAQWYRLMMMIKDCKDIWMTDFDATSEDQVKAQLI